MISDEEEDLVPLPSSSIASMPGGSSSVVAGLGRRLHSAFGGAQTVAPYRSTKSSVPR